MMRTFPAIRIQPAIPLIGICLSGLPGCFGDPEASVAAITAEVNQVLSCQGVPALTEAEVGELLDTGHAVLESQGLAVPFDVFVGFIAGQVRGCGQSICADGTCPGLERLGGFGSLGL